MTGTVRNSITLRDYQKQVLRVFDSGIRHVVLRWSRRAGKTVLAWNLIIREAMRKPGVYWFCFNRYNTAHNVVWLGMTSRGIKFLDMIPKDIVARTNSSDMEIELTNGSIIKLVGVDKADSLVGAGLSGVVFDEYAVMNPNSVGFITAMLAETGGWRVAISTPRGKNHFYEEYQFAKSHPDFAYADTRNCSMPEVAANMAPGFLEKERLTIISKYGNDALFQQEYMTSWVSPNSGSVFGGLLRIMQDSGRVCPLTINPDWPTYTAWDLGNADHTSIVLFQVNEDGHVRVVDHIEDRNKGATHYINAMNDRGWKVDFHFLPHDAAHSRGAMNESYRQVLRANGVANTVVLNRPSRVADKLDHLRRLFSTMKIDSKLERVLTCLDKLEYEWNDKTHNWSNKPTHKGGYSDTVDSLCYACQAVNKYRLTSKNRVVNLSGADRKLEPRDLLSTVLDHDLRKQDRVAESFVI